MVEGHGREKPLTSWQHGSRSEGRCQRRGWVQSCLAPSDLFPATGVPLYWPHLSLNSTTSGWILSWGQWSHHLSTHFLTLQHRPPVHASLGDVSHLNHNVPLLIVRLGLVNLPIKILEMQLECLSALECEHPVEDLALEQGPHLVFESSLSMSENTCTFSK